MRGEQVPFPAGRGAEGTVFRNGCPVLLFRRSPSTADIGPRVEEDEVSLKRLACFGLWIGPRASVDNEVVEEGSVCRLVRSWLLCLLCSDFNKS